MAGAGHTQDGCIVTKIVSTFVTTVTERTWNRPKIVGVDMIFDLRLVLHHRMMVLVHGRLVGATRRTTIVVAWSVLVRTLGSAAVDRGKRLLLTEDWQAARCGGRG